jgi:hypothetical protein
MKAVIVFESMFGSTKRVAEAVARGLGSSMEVELVEVGAAGHADLSGVDLLVVGGPTHGHGLSRSATRQAAAKDAGDSLVSRGQGVREWLASLPAATGSGHAACFDTRFDKPSWLTGSAAKTIAAQLRRRGYRLGAPPQSFFVGATPGPLLDGELDRAVAWGARLAQELSHRNRRRIPAP